MHGPPHEPPHSPEHGPPLGSCGGSKEKGGCGGRYRSSGPPEGAVDTVGRYGDGAATATMVRGAASMSGGGRVWDGPRNGVGGDARARVAQPGSSFVFTFLVGFAVRMVVVTFGFVGAGCGRRGSGRGSGRG